MNLIGGGGTSSEERGVTWNDRERGRRGDEMTGLKGKLTSKLTTTLTCVQTSNGDCVGACARVGTGIVAERGGGITTAVTESASHHLDTSARSTNA